MEMSIGISSIVTIVIESLDLWSAVSEEHGIFRENHPKHSLGKRQARPTFETPKGLGISIDQQKKNTKLNRNHFVMLETKESKNQAKSYFKSCWYHCAMFGGTAPLYLTINFCFCRAKGEGKDNDG